MGKQHITDEDWMGVTGTYSWWISGPSGWLNPYSEWIGSLVQAAIYRKLAGCNAIICLLDPENFPKKAILGNDVPPKIS